MPAIAKAGCRMRMKDAMFQEIGTRILTADNADSEWEILQKGTDFTRIARIEANSFNRA
jgi:hypothetical protein